MSIFIFRNSLRLSDNTGLLHALRESEYVIPIFIFTPEQVSNNKYKSNRCVQFMIESLDELDGKLRNHGSRLFYFFGHQHTVIKELITNHPIKAVYANWDYTPYAIHRDEKIQHVCDSLDVPFYRHHDLLLTEIGSTYLKFTPFFNSNIKGKVGRPIKNNYRNYYGRQHKFPEEFTGDIHEFYNETDLIFPGGRSHALKILMKAHKFTDYKETRDQLSIDTTHLSAYINFGCVSIREVYYSVRKIKVLLRQLYWRDFFYNITYMHPYIIEGRDCRPGDGLKCDEALRRNLNPRYNKMRWITMENATDKERDYLKAWCKGTTGFPIVDAAMRQLNETGYMHNRGRLIVASFLVKTLRWHWSVGELYFARHLIDYNVSQNTNNWQWVSGAGADSMPWFRTFNPWRQSAKRDPECIYIKRWIPELEEVPINDIHTWDTAWVNYFVYLEPIIDYSVESKKSREVFRKIYAK